jgi:tRNA threonylcarbamoyladenosine biosynthesis protein TsaB
MRILGFDTATRATAAALWDSERDEDAAEARDDPERGERPRHAAQLLPAVVELLEREALEWSDIDRIAVGIGPGTFTGLRIGIATAKALSRAREIPLVGVSTLASLALGAALSGVTRSEDARSRAAVSDQKRAGAVVAVIDARRREVFAAGWRLGEPRPRLADALTHRFLEPAALSPSDLAERLANLGGSVMAIGDGAVEFRPVLEGSGASVPVDESDLHRVSAINHCRLAAIQAAVGPDEIRPDYLRLPDAEIALRAPGSK